MTGKRKWGRPTKRSKQLETEVLVALASGATLRAASQACGIHVSTLCRWAGRYRRLRQALAKAVSDGREARRSQKPALIA